MELVKGKKYQARLAFEDQELAKAKKIAKDNEKRRKAIDEEIRVEEEAEAKIIYRQEKKDKLANRQKLVNEMQQRQIDHERAREIEKEILELERLEWEEIRRLEEERLMEEMKKAQKKDKKGGKGGKGAKGGKEIKGAKEGKDKDKAKSDKKSKNDEKSVGSKSDKSTDSKKGKGDKKSGKGSQKVMKEVVLIPDPILDEAVVKEHAYVVDREKIYEDAYWNNADYFDWEVISSLSSSDDDADYETCYQKRYPLTEQSRLREDFSSRLDKNWKIHELKQTLKSKMKSLNDIQKSTVLSKKTYFCHKEERDKRHERKQRKEEKMLEEKYNIDIKSLPKNSKVLERIKQLQAEQKAKEKGKIERRIEIIQKLLNEEKRKHPKRVTPEKKPKRKTSEVVGQEEIDLEAGGDWVDMGEVGEVDEVEPVPEVEDVPEMVVEEVTVVQEVEKKPKKGKAGEKKTKEKNKKEKVAKGDKSKKKKGKAISEEEYKPPPPPLKRERIGPENAMSDLLRDFEQTQVLEDLYSKGNTHVENLPIETGFVWKPEIVTFKDFESDKTYHRTVNISNLRCNDNIFTRFKEVKYPTGLLDPLLLTVKCQEFRKVCPGLGFTFEVRFQPNETTKSFEAKLVFLSKRGVNGPLSEFLIPVECNIEEPEMIELIPKRLTFPTVPSWSHGKFGVHLCKTVQLVNKSSKTYTVSILNSDDLSGFLTLDDDSNYDLFADVNCEDLDEVERVLDRPVLGTISEQILDMFGQGLTMVTANQMLWVCSCLEEVPRNSVDPRYDYTDGDETPALWPKMSIDYRLQGRDSLLFGRESRLFRMDSRVPTLDSRLNVKRSEKGLSETMSRWELLYPRWSIQENREQSACSDLLDECFDNVFLTFRSEDKYKITVPPRSTTKVKLHFNAYEAGKFEEKLKVIVTDDKDTFYETYFRAFAETTPLPIRVSPSALNFKVCVQDGGLYQDVIKVFNDGKLPCAVQPTIPPSLRKFVFIRPAQCHVQPHSFSNFAIKFAPSWKIHYDASRYYSDSKVEFPIRIVIKGTAYGKCPSLRVSCKATITSAYNLQLRPAKLELGRVSTNETVSAELQLTNNSLVAHEFAFLNLPEFVMIHPNYGFGTIAAGQTVKLDLLYSPGSKNIAGNAIGKAGLEGMHLFNIQVTTKACLAGGFKGNKNKMICQIVEEQKLLEKAESIDDDEENDLDEEEEDADAFGSIKSDNMIYSEDELWSSNLELPEVRDPIAEQEEELLKHLEQIFADEDDLDVSDNAVSLQLQDDIGRKRSVVSDAKSWISSGVNDPSVGSLKNLVRFNEGDTSTIMVRWADAIDKRVLKTEIEVLAVIYDPLCGFSSSRIEFPSTPCGSYAILSFTLESVNKVTATECYCGLLKKIDNRKFTASFKFMSPTNELVFVPSKGKIKAGEKVKIYVVFRPALPYHEVVARARELKAQKLIAQKRQEYFDELENAKKNKKGKKGKEKKQKEKKGKQGKGSVKDSESSVPEFEVDPSTVTLEYIDNFPAEKSLFQVLEPSCTTHTVSCVVDISSATHAIDNRRDYLKLTVVCPVIRPDFVIKPDTQRVQFGPVAIGTRPKTTLGILNICSKRISVKISPVNPVGAFLFPSPQIPFLEPEHTVVVPVTFAPDRPVVSEEYVEIRSGRTVISVIVTGKGVTPVYSFTPDFLLYRFDGPSGKKKGDCKVVIENACEAPLSFSIEQVYLKDAVDKPMEKPIVQEEEGVKGKKDKKEKKDKKSKKKPEKMCTELSPEDEFSLNEEFKDMDRDAGAVFEIVGLEEKNEILVPPKETREFKVKFVPPKSNDPAGTSGSKKGKSKEKSSESKEKGKGKSTAVSKPMSVKSLKSGTTVSGSAKTVATDETGVEGGKCYPQKYAAKYKVTLGKLVEVKEIIFMGFLKKGKKGK